MATTENLTYTNKSKGYNSQAGFNKKRDQFLFLEDMDQLKARPVLPRHQPFLQESTHRAPCGPAAFFLSSWRKRQEKPGNIEIQAVDRTAGSIQRLSLPRRYKYTLQLLLSPPSPPQNLTLPPLPAALHVAAATVVWSSGGNPPPSRHGSRPVLRHRQEGQGWGRALFWRFFLLRIRCVLLAMDGYCSDLIGSLMLVLVRRSPVQGLPHGPEVYPYHLRLEWSREYYRFPARFYWPLAVLRSFWFECSDC